jgi:ketosteroid isomerase-like protein
MNKLIAKSAAGLIAATLATSLGSFALADNSATTEAVVNHHLGAFGAGDVDALLSDYTAESVMITADGHLTGPDELRPAFEGLVAEFSKPGVIFEMQHMSVVDDVAYIVWNAETDDNIYQIGTDTFVVKDGKIMKQTFTTLTVSKK